MAEYIERAAAIKAIQRQHGPNNSVAQNRLLALAVRDVLRVAAADVAQVRHGRWQYNTNFYVWCCSECGENPHKGTGVVAAAEKLPACCPHCGAKIDGAE